MEHTAPTDVLLVEDLSQQRLPARSLTAILRRAGLSARLVHFGSDADPDEIVALVQRESPRLVVLSILFAFLVEENLALAACLRAAGVTAHVTMAGPLPTFAYADLLAACPALDSVLRGEAEASLVRLAASLNFKTDWRATPGLAYRSPSADADALDTLQTNPLPPPIAELDDLPFPARDDGIPKRLDFGFATIEGSQGCYHACAFCLPSAFYRSSVRSCYRLRSIPNLVEEMEALYRQGTRLFLFDDEQFLPPGQARGERVQALGDALKRRGLDIAFTIKCRPDDVDETLLGHLKAMGLIRVYLGVESGCQTSLDRLGKRTTVEQNARALAVLDRLGIVTDFRSLLFHPWSTPETVESDLEFMVRVLPLVATPFIFSEVGCYPGTPLGGQLRAEGRAGVGAGPIGSLSYLIAAPGIELLRRMGRVVFGARDAERGIPNQIAQAWFDNLLLRRFQPNRRLAGRAHRLRESVARLNRESLVIWQEMLSFVAAGDLYDAGRVNERVAAWASRANAVDVAVETDLERIKVAL
jgi:anaerobic magnesium-protoporphyrin IX monomethyl ester cyclase